MSKGYSYYVAPENIKKEEALTSKSDIFAAGVLCHILFTGQPPYIGENNEEVLNNIKQGLYMTAGSEWEGVSQVARKFV
jgi:calcium-dependent protein kinase